MPLIDAECTHCIYSDEIIVTSIDEFDHGRPSKARGNRCPCCGHRLIRAEVHELPKPKPGMQNLPFTVKI